MRGLLRTVRVAGNLLSTMAVDLARHGAPSHTTTTARGLAAIRGDFVVQLARLGITVEVRHAERVPTRGGVVFMWNQTSHLDHLVLPVGIPRPFHLTYNNEVRRFPIYGRYLAASEHFWIDRTDETQWRVQLARAARRVRDGACVLISPEGTRSHDGRLLPMKRGAFVLAREAGMPIVCVTIRGARACLPRGSGIVRPGLITIELSQPIPIETVDLKGAVVATFEAALHRG